MEILEDTRFLQTVMDERCNIARAWISGAAEVANIATSGVADRLVRFAEDDTQIAVPGTVIDMRPGKSTTIVGLSPVMEKNDAPHLDSQDPRQRISDDLSPIALLKNFADVGSKEMSVCLSTYRGISQRGRGIVLLSTLFEAEKHSKQTLPGRETSDYWEHRVALREFQFNLLGCLGPGFDEATALYRDTIEMAGTGIEQRSLSAHDTAASERIRRLLGKTLAGSQPSVGELNVFCNLAWDQAVYGHLGEQSKSSVRQDYASYLTLNRTRFSNLSPDWQTI